MPIMNKNTRIQTVIENVTWGRPPENNDSFGEIYEGKPEK
jgi:hypothetical protein